jgi:hypothetical protein
LVCRYCGSDDLAASFRKRRDARCRACFKERDGSASRDSEDREHSEDESRKVVYSKVEIGSGPGFAEGPGPDRGSVAPSRFDRANAWTGINVSAVVSCAGFLLRRNRPIRLLQSGIFSPMPPVSLR